MTDRRETASWIAVMAAAGLALYLCWLMLQPFIDVLLWAVVLAIAFKPLQDYLVARTGRPTVSAAISCVAVVLVLLLPLAFIGLVLANEISSLAETLPQQVEELLRPDAPWLQQVRPWLDPYIKLDDLRSKEFYQTHLEGVAKSLGGHTLNLIGNVIGVVFKFVLVLFTLFYLFIDGPHLVAALHARLPLDDAQSDAIIKRTREVLDASLYGVLAIALIQGFLGGLAFWALGVPSPALWGMIMTITAIIPLAGTPVVWVPVALYLVAIGDWGKGIILLAWGGLVISQIDNFLRPRLVGKKARLHALAIFFSVLGGIQAFGFLGLFLGPVVVAITLALLDVLQVGASLPLDIAPGAKEPEAEAKNEK